MKILASKSAAWIAFVIIIAVFVATFRLRAVWWAYFDIFFAFMMVFCHVIALTIARYNRFASSKLEKIAGVMGILAILAILAEGIAFSMM